MRGSSSRKDLLSNMASYSKGIGVTFLYFLFIFVASFLTGTLISALVK